MTPPPLPPEPARKTGGKPINLPSQSIITTSSSVQAGLATLKFKDVKEILSHIRNVFCVEISQGCDAKTVEYP